VLAAGLVIAWGAAVIYIALRLTRPPRRTTGWAVARRLPTNPGELTWPDGTALAFTDTQLAASDGLMLPAWEVIGRSASSPATGTSVNAPRPITVIFLPGWGESRVTSLPRLVPLAAHAHRVIMIDSRGHGDAPGRCTLGTTETADLIDHIHAIRKIDGPHHQIVLAGFSLGAGVCIAAAAKLASQGSPVAGVIAEAPYRLPPTPATRVLSGAAVPYRLGILWGAQTIVGLWAGAARGWRSPGGSFDRAALAATLAATTPVLWLHGRDDAVSPLQDGQIIAENAKAVSVIIEQCGHNDLWTVGRKQASAAVGAFLDRLQANG